MLLAAIDIGSNAVRLLFSNVIERNDTTVMDKATLVRIPIRLGEDVFTSGIVSPHKEEKLIKTLTAFKLLIEVYEPLAYRACATAAMREAQNSDSLIERIQRETGLNVQVIDGLEEAAIVTAADSLKPTNNYKYKLYIDVGGGSTELSLMKGQQLHLSGSFKIGTIRLREGRVDASEWQRLKEWLKPLKEEEGNVFCVGSGGNINKIAKLFAKTEPGIIFLRELEKAKKDLAAVSLEYRIQQMGLRPDRADVIVPASEIFVNVMKWAALEFVAVPKIGLPDGLVHMMYQEIISSSTPPGTP